MDYLQLVERSETLPITLDEIKAHLGIIGDDDDDRLTALIWSVADEIENWTGRDFVGHTWALTLPCFYQANLKRSPVSEITGVEYFDASNEEQTLATSVYSLVKTYQGPSQLKLKPDQDWPETYVRDDAVTITYVGGEERPPLYSHTLKVGCGLYNEQREGQAPDRKGYDRLLAQLCDGRYH